MKLRRNADTPARTTRTDRCPRCGTAMVRTPHISDESPLGPARWVICGPCRDTTTRRGLLLAMLSTHGVDYDEAADETALDLVELDAAAWLARGRVERLDPAAADHAANLAHYGIAADPIGPVEDPDAAPWSHLDRSAVQGWVDDARRRVEAHRAGPPRRRGKTPCGGCGVRTAPRWHAPVQMPTGARWGICGACHDRVWLQAGCTAQGDRWPRRLLAEALGVARPAMSFSGAMRSYAEVCTAGPDTAAGTAERFGWVTPAEWADVYAAHPRFAPDHVRDRAERLLQADARMAASASGADLKLLDGWPS